MSEITLEYNSFTFKVNYDYSPGNLNQKPSWTEPPEGPTVEILTIYIAPKGTDFPLFLLGMNQRGLDATFEFIYQELPELFVHIEDEIIKLEGERR